MSNKKLAILALVAAVSVIWAVIQARPKQKPTIKSENPLYLIQGLDPADVGSLVLQKGQSSMTLTRQSAGFVVDDKDGYPAVAEKINELIAACMDIRTAGLVTDSKENHKALGIDEENAEVVARFLRPDSSLLTGIIVGKTKGKDKGTYVRRIDEDKVYLTLETPPISTTAMYYIDQQLVKANRFQTETVTVKNSDETYTLKSLDFAGTKIKLENMPADKQFKDKQYEQVFSVLTSLRFTDVIRQSPRTKQLNFDRQFIATLKDSTIYTLGLAQHDGKTYVTCTAEFTDKTPITKEKTVESEEQLKKKEAKLIARDKAAEFAAKHKGWLYEIPDYKADYMLKTLADLLEHAPTEPTDSASENN